jgi:predicted aspartyl protease
VPPAAPPTPVAQPAPAPPPTPTVAAPAPQPDTGADFNLRPNKQPSTKVVDIDIGGDGYLMLTRVRLGSSTYVTAVVDTGATITSIPERIGLELVSKGEAAFERRDNFKMADGSMREVSVIRIKEFQVGTYTLHDVLAGLAPSGADVLLGMSALDQLGPMTIDKDHHQLLFG